MDSNEIMIATISARGGSKEIPGKNLLELKGIPLIAHSLKRAKECGVFEAISVSSDSDDILHVAQEYEATYTIKRPDELASDSASKLDSIKHCVLETERRLGKQVSIIVDLDVTAPFRSVDDILGVVELLKQAGTTNVITGKAARRSPYFNLVEQDEDGAVHLSKPPQRSVVRRQDAPLCYDMNASIYAWWRKNLLENDSLFLEGTKLYEMPEERSIDIDSPMDLEFARFLAEKKEYL